MNVLNVLELAPPLLAIVSLWSLHRECARERARCARLLRDRFEQQTFTDRLQAEARAKELFLESLTDQQRRDWSTIGKIEITGSDGRRYELGSGSYNVAFGRRRYCATALGVPAYDTYLTQKLAIEANVKTFFAVANSNSFLSTL